MSGVGISLFLPPQYTLLRAPAARGAAPAAEALPASAAAPGRSEGGVAPAVSRAFARMPQPEELDNAEEQAARLRIRYPGDSEAEEDAAFYAAQGWLRGPEGQPERKEGALTGAEKDAAQGTDGAEDADSPAEVMEEAECETCEKRQYQDGSDDPGVSFKLPTKLSPDEAPAAVRGHEMEHVVREQAKAEREGRKVVSQTVTIHTDVCPECGRVYVSGGTTRTVTAADSDAETSGENAAQSGTDASDDTGRKEETHGFEASV